MQDSGDCPALIHHCAQQTLGLLYGSKRYVSMQYLAPTPGPPTRIKGSLCHVYLLAIYAHGQGHHIHHGHPHLWAWLGVCRRRQEEQVREIPKNVHITQKPHPSLSLRN